ncbi:suppressor of fused domain protein [Polyangium mundeleinium]|uniref:Suppressor of fused domain protein n=1 Tax=Polyangium mundeleinium TaxID=2995306 RepID=A0ABT5EUG7_9BACT|nr:suppressor of fused domain protein [Polyangium mundeleinium]MDC0745460.1 suppressor of fused domain protein [Polyangium mundeleinium]
MGPSSKPPPLRWLAELLGLRLEIKRIVESDETYTRESADDKVQRVYTNAVRKLPDPPPDPWTNPKARDALGKFHGEAEAEVVLQGPKGEDRRFEFVMSLPVDWNPSERWPAYMFQRASSAILAAGLAPDEGGVVFNSAEAVHGSPHVFALLVAPSRQFGEHAAFRTPSGGLVEIDAMYPLTSDEWQLHQTRQLVAVALPEVIEHWRDMLR